MFDKNHAGGLLNQRRDFSVVKAGVRKVIFTKLDPDAAPPDYRMAVAYAADSDAEKHGARGSRHLR